ncbi:hypothetical protein C8R47DRAFT_1163688 [Mycena vitilis]|nr:hypothetical protein C8R47DRAFT_1163688 [Mycena vitilis]
MASLSRPPTPQSTHSWWSDTNSIGPTFSIHAVAKPLMRLMYHQQVRSFVRINRDIPVSRATMDISFSYLAFKHVSPATKVLILKELDARSELTLGDAAVVAHSLGSAWDIVTQLLRSADMRTRQYTCHLLGTLAPFYDSTSSRLEICGQLASLLADEATEVQSVALYAIRQISEGGDGVQAVADTEIWEYFPESLDSWNLPSGQRRGNAEVILANLAVNETMKIECAGDGTPIEVCRGAIYALSKISRWPEGVRAIMEAMDVDVVYLLNSCDAETRKWTHVFLRNMADYQYSTVRSVRRITGTAGSFPLRVADPLRIQTWADQEGQGFSVGNLNIRFHHNVVRSLGSGGITDSDTS